MNKKLLESPLLEKLDQEKYFTYLRNIRKSIELFREENLPIQSEIAVLQQQYGQVTGAMTITVNGTEYTLQQAGKFLESHDRSVREEVYRKIQDRRLESRAQLNELYDKLIALRNKEAMQAGFDNYRDYRFKELGRFDYDKEDCFRFHEAVKLHVLPLVNNIYRKNRKPLALTDCGPGILRPNRPEQNRWPLSAQGMNCWKNGSVFP